MRSIFLALVVSMTSLFSACESKPLPTYGTVGKFSFVDHSNQPFALESLKGKVWLLNFFFTSCPAVCPGLMGKMATLQRQLSGFDVVSITVDPKTDTPDKLREYGEKFSADFSRWHLVNAPDEKLKEFAVRALKIGMAEDINAHTVRWILVDSAGDVRGYYLASDVDVVDQAAKDIKSLL